MRRTNPRYKVLQMLRKCISVSTRLRVEYVGDGKERLTCCKCGWTLVQNLGGIPDDRMPTNMQLVERLVKYRDHGGGIWGVCDGCSLMERDKRYPMTGVPRYL